MHLIRWWCCIASEASPGHNSIIFMQCLKRLKVRKNIKCFESKTSACVLHFLIKTLCIQHDSNTRLIFRAKNDFVSSNHFLAGLVVRFGLLSCWKDHIWLIPTLLAKVLGLSIQGTTSHKIAQRFSDLLIYVS